MCTIAQQRAVNQGLSAALDGSPADVTAHLGAVQAQDYPGAQWSLGLRLPGSTAADIEAALDGGSFVRTWTLRGTLHFVAAQDLGWQLRLVGPGLIAGNARRYRQLELDEATLARGSAILGEALADGGRLKRPALLDILEQRGISTQGQRGVYLLQRASLEGLIYQVGERSRYGIFQAGPGLPAGPFDRAEAAARLARRYFESHGPATWQDFAWWSGLPAAQARAALQAGRPDLVEEPFAGQSYWHSTSSSSEAGIDAGEILLLPGFDEFLVAYKDRSASIAPEHMPAWSQSKAMFSPTIVKGGRVIGLWKRSLKRGKVRVHARLFHPISSGEEQALAAAAQSYADFLDTRVEMAL